MSENEDKKNRIIVTLEALLFVTPEPISISHLAFVTGVSTKEVESCLEQLTNEYQHKGIRIQKYKEKVIFSTAPELATSIERFLDMETISRLSRASLETLAIVAYQQPVTRPQIENIRGVSCDGVLKSLLGKGLIQETGRAETPGRPILYETTLGFLQHFGIKHIYELPEISRALEF